MPPTKKRKHPRCIYVEGRRQCTRNGTGDPPLCAVHELVVEEEEYEELDLIDEILERVDEATESLADKIRSFLSPRIRPPDPVRTRAPNGNNHKRPPVNGQRRAPPPPPAVQNEVSEKEARLVLGIPLGVKITKEMIRARKRQLAAIFHPDAGGALEAMQRVNTAADKLLKSLG